MQFQLISLFVAISAAAVLPSSSTTSSIAPAATLSIPSKGFTIPASHTNGTYMVEINSDGEEIHTKLTSSPLTSSYTKTSRSKLARRADPMPVFDPAQINCAGLGDCPVADVRAAASQLAGQCDDITKAVTNHRSFYSLTNEVAFYYCNFSPVLHQCSGTLAEQVVDIVGLSECGENGEGGWYNLPTGNSYGYQLKDQSFCGWGM